MIGSGELLSKPQAQVIFAPDQQTYDRAKALFPDRYAIVAYDPDDPDVSALAGRRVVVIDPDNVFAGLIHLAGATEVKTLPAIPESITRLDCLDWAKNNAILWDTDKPANFAITESNGQGGGSSPLTATPAQVIPLSGAASPDPLDPKSAARAIDTLLPSQEDNGRAAADPLNAALGDDQDATLPDVPEWLLNVPVGDSEPPNGHDYVEPSGVWVSPLGDENEWGEPTDVFDTLSAPKPMQTSMLFAWMHDFAQDRAIRIGGDPGAIVQSMLVCFSALIDDRFSIQVKQHDTWKESARLWGLCLGDSSTKKNPLMESATGIVQRINQEARKAGVQRLKEYADACDKYQVRRKAWISENAKLPQGSPETQAPLEPEPIEQDWFICEDYTSEALARALENQTKRKILITGDEPSFLAFDRYSSGKQSSGRADFLSLYQGRPRSILRVGTGDKPGGRYVESWSAAMLCGSTPSSLRGMLGPVSLMQDGLVQRCLINVASDAVMGEDREPDHVAGATYERACRNLFAMRALGDGVIKSSPEASRLFQQFEDWVQREMSSPIYSAGHTAHIGKWAGQAPRLALTLMLADYASRSQEPSQGETLSAEYMRVAIDLLTRWQADQVRWLWDMVLGDGREVDADLRMICEAIACNYAVLGGGKVSIAEVQNSFKKWKVLEQRQKSNYLASLVNMHWLVINTPTAKLQSPGVWTSYRINPLVYKRFGSIPEIIMARERRRLTGAKFTELRLAKQAQRDQDSAPLH